MAMAFPIHHLIILLVLLVPPLFVVPQTPNISLNSYLIASEQSTSWKSPSGEFPFGFQRLENQELFLLAIWFDKIPNKTIVWYADGDNPVPKESKVELTTDGRLTLKDPQGVIIWNAMSTVNEIGSVIVEGSAYAAMLDTGNFVLVNRDSGYAWESFKDPADTILPTQVLEIGGKLSSRQTASNYSKGRFQLRLLQNGNLELITIALPKGNPYDPPYYLSNTSGGADSMNSGYRVVFNESGDLYVVLRNGKTVNLTSGNIVPSKDYYYRATLDFDGTFTQYACPKAQRYGNVDQSWSIVWSIPNDICSAIKGDEGYGSCGFNSYCVLDSNGKPTCHCIPGFNFSDPNNKFNGCKQDRVLKCEPGGSKPEDLYEMRELPNVFWPTSATFEWQPSNEDECSRSCFYDCDCVVAVLRDGCSKKKLPLTNGIVIRSVNGKAFFKVPKSNVSFGDPVTRNPEMKKNDQAMVIPVLLGSSAFLNFLLITAVLLVILFSCKKREMITSMSSILDTNLRNFTYEELREATDRFKEELGRGAFGTVYKGVLSSSNSRNIIAVKKLDKVMQEGEREFQTEASAIAKTHHRNLVRLLGFCDEGPHKLLVYEYMSNGTLASFLFGISRPDWKKRTQIAFEIARGLLYLHEECSTQIIHCDIKPQNILLDDSFTTKISDFGLAKLLMSDQTRTLTTIRGTKGYVAPEWFRNTPITAKVDVYSYGVMLLEIICCRKSLEMERENEEEVILTDWVYDCYKERRLDKLVENDEGKK